MTGWQIVTDSVVDLVEMDKKAVFFLFLLTSALNAFVLQKTMAVTWRTVK